jgi:hypothetical protein
VSWSGSRAPGGASFADRPDFPRLIVVGVDVRPSRRPRTPSRDIHGSQAALTLHFICERRSRVCHGADGPAA